MAGAAQAELTLKDWTSLPGGLYRHNKSGGLYHRPVINGKRTYRTLKTKSEKVARALIAQSGVAQEKARAGLGPDPFAPKNYTTVGEIVEKYLADGCMDRQRQARTVSARKRQVKYCGDLRPFWDHVQIGNVTLAEMDRYHDVRKTQIRGGPGESTIDKELEALGNAFTWAVRCGIVKYNPLVGHRVKYAQAGSRRHCREFMPAHAEELHAVARWLFLNNFHHGCQAGWQYLLEAFTGLRTGEAIGLRTDARPGEPGHIITDPRTGAWKQLEVGRLKHGGNPFVAICKEKQAMLEALFAWSRERYPASPWFVPSRNGLGKNHICHSALADNLRRASKHFGKKFSSHGARAYYVTARRSWGISDVQIAIEIGHRGGAHLISTTYGAVPTNWLTGDGPKMTWMPLNAPPAWDVLNLPLHSNVVQLPNARIA